MLMNYSYFSPEVLTPTLITLVTHYYFQVQGDTFLLWELFLFAGITAYDSQFLQYDFSASMRAAGSSILAHLLLTCAITIIFRLSPLHPLAKFPGPFLNKITSFKLAWSVASGKRFLVVDELHRQYGKFVRTAPNSLSVNSYDAISPIYRDTECLDKTTHYSLGRSAGDGIFFIQSREEHNIRKRYWAGAFKARSAKQWSQILEKRTIELTDCIRNRRDKNQALDLTEAFQHWSYDVMGSLTFGKSSGLELMVNGDPNGYVDSGQLATIMFEVIGEVASILNVLRWFPVTDKISALENLAGGFMKTRMNDPSADDSDLTSYLLGEHNPTFKKLSFRDLKMDSLFAIQAGSDTSASVLVILFFYVLRDKAVYKKLREELFAAFPDPHGALSVNVLNSLPYLNGVVHEALRFGTPFGGFPRVTPRGGMVLENTHIPERVTISVPTWSIDMSEEHFSPKPTEFLPERWNPNGLGEDMRTNANALMSFGVGPFGCLGRNLAIQELRVVTARLMLEFDLELAPSFNEQKFLDGIKSMRTTYFMHHLAVVAKSR